MSKQNAAEWKRRTDYYPHPGDCFPATGINFTGERRAIVFVCPKCEAAKKELERASSAATPERPLRGIDPAVLAKIESELAGLEKGAPQEAGPDWPPPSRQIAYYLLAGLAIQGTAMERLLEAEQRLFDVEQRGGVRAKLMSVFTDVRVALLDHWIQDKAGTYLRRKAVLYVQREGKWLEKGKGAITAPDQPNP